MREFPATPELCPTKKDLTPGDSSRCPRISGVVASAASADLARRRLLTAIAAAPVISFPVVAAAERHLSDGDDTAIFIAYDDWHAAREALHTLELSHDSSNEYDAVCDAAWDVQNEAGQRLAELTATTPQGAATQLRWLLSHLKDGILPVGMEPLLERLETLLVAMAATSSTHRSSAI